MASESLKRSVSLITSRAAGILTRWSKFGAKPRITKSSNDELQFEIPVRKVEKKSDVSMFVDENNRFVLTAENKEKGVYYKQILNLPNDYNFEKASIEAKVESDLVKVSVTNFLKEKFMVRIG